MILVNFKRYITLGIILFVVLFCSSISYAADKAQNDQESKQIPISVAAKYDNSIYLNKIEYHNYLFNGEKRIPIPVKYYYRVKNYLVFLAEDNTLYYTDKEATDIKELLKGTKTTVSTDESGDYIYALTTKDELYRITVDNFKIEKIKRSVTILYSAWKDWVVFQTSDKKWYKQFINGQTIQIEHKGSEQSPLVPDTEIGSEASSVKHIIVGPWCINEVKHLECYTRHGGENSYYDYTTYSWEYRDGSSDQHQFYSVFNGSLHGIDNYYSNPNTGSLKVLGSDENNLYISLIEEFWNDDYSSTKTYIKVFLIKSIDKENSKQENYSDDQYYKRDANIINYNKCIYEEKLEDTKKVPQFYWTPNGIYKLSADKRNIDLISLDNNLITHLFNTENELSNVKMLSDNLYFEERLKDGVTEWGIDLKNGHQRKVNKTEINSKDWDWNLSNVKKNTLYINGSKSNSYKLAKFFEGDGIWLYSKGKVNGIYKIGNYLLLLRESKLSAVKKNVSNIDWNKSFSLDGWIYLCADGYYLRFQPDNPSVIQTMNIILNSPVFESQNVIGFYNKSLGIYTWKGNSYKAIAKLQQPESNYSKLTVIKNAYIYYNSMLKRIESASKSGKVLKVVSGNMRVGRDFLFNFGYIYFIDEDSKNLYRVLSDGSKLQKILGDCINVTGFQDKLICVLRNGVYSLSSLGKNKHLIINKTFDYTTMENESYVQSVVPAGKRLIVFLEEGRLHPDSEFTLQFVTEIHSVTMDSKNDVILPSTENNKIIDSNFYYTDIDGRVWRMGLDGKGRELLL